MSYVSLVARGRAARVIAALALAFAVSAVSATRAEAVPASSLKDAFAGPNLAKALTCPATTLAASATSDIPGVGEVTDQLSNVVCALNILGYAYRTTYIRPDGEKLVRYTRATVLLPTLIDVDGNLVPDFTGTLTPSLVLTGVYLNIQRLSFPGSGKVKIEAVLLNPLTPNNYLAFGQDGTAAGTAGNFAATVSFFGLSSSTVDLGLSLRAGSPPSKLGVTGEVFSGTDPDNPDKINRGDVFLEPFGTTTTTRVRLSEGRQQAIITTPAPSKVDVHVDVIRRGVSHHEVDATIDKLPDRVDVVHTTDGEKENVTYTANAPIDTLDATYRQSDGAGTPKKTARLDIAGVPAKVTFDQEDGVSTINAPEGSFGSVEARYAQGTELPARRAGTTPYAAFHRMSSSELTGGLRLNKLKSAAIDQTGPYAGQLIFSEPLGPLTLSAQDDVNTVKLKGTLSSLPLNTSVAIDTDNGVVTFDGHGQGLDQIAISATKTNGEFFPKTKRIDATIDGIPPLETINFKQTDGTVKVAASDPPQTISLLASDGSGPPAVDGSYAWLENTNTRYRAFARISKLKEIAFGSTPVAGTFDTSQAQVLNLHAEAKGGVTVDGKIDKLPSHVHFTMAGERVHIENHGVIDHIHLQAKGLPESAKFDNAKVDVYGISPILDVYLGGGAITTQTAERSSTTTRGLRDQNCPPEGCSPSCQEDPEFCDDPGDGGGGGGGGDPAPPPWEDPELFGVDAHGHGVNLILVHAWANGSDPLLHPELPANRSLLRDQNCPAEGCSPTCQEDPEFCDDPGDGGGDGGGNTPVTPPPFGMPSTANAVLYDGNTGQEDLRARIANLKHAKYTKSAPNPEAGSLYPPDVAFNGADELDIEFTQPGDITLGIRKQDKAHGTVTIPHVENRTLPTRYRLRLGTDRVIKASFRPNAVIPQVNVAMAVGKDEAGKRKALIDAGVENIPTEADVCIGKDFSKDCKPWMVHNENVGGDVPFQELKPELDFNLTTNGPPVNAPGAMTINGRICLGDIGSTAWVPAACMNDHVAEKYIDIRNLRVRNFDVEYRQNVDVKYNGDFAGGDSLALYANTDGVMVDRLRFVKPDGGKGVEFIQTGAPMTATHHYFAFEWDTVPGFVHGPVGSLECPGNTELYLLERSATGQVSHYDLPGPESNDLIYYIPGC